MAAKCKNWNLSAALALIISSPVHNGTLRDNTSELMRNQGEEYSNRPLDQGKKRQKMRRRRNKIKMKKGKIVESK